MKKFYNKYRPLLITIAFFLVVFGLVFAMTRERTIVVNNPQLNVRTGPGIEYQQISTIHGKKRVTVVGKRNEWYRVRLNDHKFGWVASWLVNSRQVHKTAKNLTEATIVIDPGHGGSDSGASYDNSKKPSRLEKTYTLQLAQKVAADLRAHGARVIMTRNSDHYVGLAPRPQLAESANADAFVSFHYDSSPQANQGTGVTTYYYHRGASKRLARAVNSQFNNLPLSNKGIDFGNFEVIRDNTRPAILCEMGYINSTKDYKKIKSPTYQFLVTHDVVKGLNQFIAQNRRK